MPLRMPPAGTCRSPACRSPACRSPACRSPAWWSLGAALLLALLAVPARAQQPSPEQAAAVRQACRSDYIEHCSSVPTGGAAALGCLRQNEAQLAPACRQAVDAIASAAPPTPGAGGGGTMAARPGQPPGHPPGQPPGEPPGELFGEECGPDVRRICRGAPPGGGRVIACLVENRGQLSPGCRAAMMELRERR